MGWLPKWLGRLFGRQSSANLTSNESGKGAEAAAEALLIRDGHRVLARNLKGKGGELDLVSLDPTGVIVIVEVRSLRPGPGFRLDRALPPGKQSQVIQAARKLLPKQSWWRQGTPLRFDAVLVELTKDGQIARIEHHPDAFRANRRDWF